MKMKYSYGYVAFIDILGFSNLILQKNTIEDVNTMIEFVFKFRYLYNTSNKLKVKIEFFSDSIVMTIDENSNSALEQLLTAIHIASIALYKNTGLFYRGGITKGYYHHTQSTVFGPAIIKAYQLENEAKYPRIIIDSEVVDSSLHCNEPLTDYLEIEKDNDGKFFYNCFIDYCRNNTLVGNKPTVNEVYESYCNEREKLINTFKKYKYTSVIDKYTWLINSFNKTIKRIKIILAVFMIDYYESDIDRILDLRIDIDEIMNEEKTGE